MQIKFTLRWQIEDAPARELPPELIALLDGVARGGNLRFGARESGLSYRHAWGLIKQWEGYFGEPLVVLERGRGATVTASGDALRQAWHKTTERSAAGLADAARFAGQLLSALGTARGGSNFKLAASHGFGITTAAELLRARGCQPEIQFLGSEESLRRYAAGDCLTAGFHIPLGELGRTLWRQFAPYFNLQRDSFLLVETRELGFMAKRGSRPVGCAEIARRKMRFLNRQPGSGSRLVFDLLLARAGLQAEAINGYHNEEYTHLAVAATIAAGQAEVGFGVRAAAEKFALAFAPEVIEKYLLVVPRDGLSRPPLSALHRVLQSAEYRRQLKAIPGTDASRAGTHYEVKDIVRLITPKSPAKRVKTRIVKS